MKNFFFLIQKIGPILFFSCSPAQVTPKTQQNKIKSHVGKICREVR